MDPLFPLRAHKWSQCSPFATAEPSSSPPSLSDCKKRRGENGNRFCRADVSMISMVDQVPRQRSPLGTVLNIRGYLCTTSTASPACDAVMLVHCSRRGPCPEAKGWCLLRFQITLTPYQTAPLLNYLTASTSSQSLFWHILLGRLDTAVCIF